MEQKILSVLDRIEAMRIRAIENPDSYTADYCMRVAEGIISAEFGYYGRTEWMDKLKADPTTMMYKRAHR